MKKPLNNYYDQHGIMTYEYDRTLLVDIDKALATQHYQSDLHERGVFCNEASNLIYDHSIIPISSPGGMDKWLDRNETCPIRNALKPVFKDFVNKKYVPQEFLLVANAIICDIQLTRYM